MIALHLSMPKVNLFYLLVGTLIFVALSLGVVGSVSAHGYVDSPESRALLCKEDVNKNCGRIIYEPHSLEGPGNFPQAGVPDGNIASAGIFTELDEQTENRWAKVPMTSGANTFNWTLTAAHATRGWDYYITKEGWDPNSPLERADFELFCQYNDNGKRPDFQVRHECDIPERDGYHVILAYWEVADTPNAFYQVIDANFGGGFIEPKPDPDPENAYNSTKVYLGGDRVTHNGKVYVALWWTQGQEPGTNSVWLLVSDDDGGGGDPLAEAYDAGRVYVGGDLVSYNGKIYRAAWWTLGETPGSSSVWVLQ